MCCGRSSARRISMPPSHFSPSASGALAEPPRSSRPKSMLRLRILTAAVLSCILAVVLFVLTPRWSVLVFGVVWTIARLGMGRLRRAARAAWRRLLYACAIALLLLLSWQWSADPGHLLVLLAGACVWWGDRLPVAGVRTGAAPAAARAAVRSTGAGSGVRRARAAAARESRRRARARNSFCGCCCWCLRRTSARSSPGANSAAENWRRA